MRAWCLRKEVTGWLGGIGRPCEVLLRPYACIELFLQMPNAKPGTGLTPSQNYGDSSRPTLHNQENASKMEDNHRVCARKRGKLKVRDVPPKATKERTLENPTIGLEKKHGVVLVKWYVR